MWLIIPALLTVHVIICLLLVLVVLMQLPRSEGLGAAFGGAVTENMFGAQTTHVLARFTVWLGVAFFVVTLALAMAYAKRTAGKSAIQRELMKSPPAAAAPAELPSATPTVAEPAPASTPAASPAAVETPAATPVVEEAAVAEPTATPEVPAPAASPVPAAP